MIGSRARRSMGGAVGLVLLAGLAAAGCGSDGGSEEAIDPHYILGSVVIDAEGRTTYVQAIESLDAGPFDNSHAVEVPGNAVLLARGRQVFVGRTDAPLWIRYEVDAKGHLAETGRMSISSTGATAVDYGNALVDAETAVSVLSDPPKAVVWNPSTMTIKGTVDLSFLSREGYGLEVWTTVAHEGKVYVPGRWADWTGGRIYPAVSLTILDPATLSVVGTAYDERCASGGRPVFDEDGYAYVMGDGRTYSIQMYANAAGEEAPQNCLLRIAPGETDFQEDWYHAIPALTGGVEAIDELQSASAGVGFAKLFYEDLLPDGVEPVDFSFWSIPVHKLWRFTLGDVPVAEEVDGSPFSVVGFTGAAMGGHLFTGESDDGATSQVYETDPVTNTASVRFTMDGYFYGLWTLDE
ncbi:MAG: hypothetical protein QM767_06015 [Anaeromyxobacter sp.]